MATSGRRRTASGLAVLSTLLGACAPSHGAADTGTEPARSASTAVSITSPATAPTPTATTPPLVRHTHRPYSDVNPPPRRAGDFIVEVLLVSRGAPADDAHPARTHRSGPQFWGEEVRTCVKQSSRRSHVVGWQDWRLASVDGHLYPADASGPQPVRTPAFPQHRVLSPGQCVTWWWLVTFPAGPPIRSVQFAPDGGPALIAWPSGI